MTSPIVSVVITAYNVAPYIRQAVDSVLAQTLQDIEVIVVDDASSDETFAELRACDDPRVIILKNATNGGPAAARNRGLRQARGQWVAILDGDDWWAPHRLERLLRYADSRGADVVCDDLFFVRDGEEMPYGTYLTECHGGAIPYDGPANISLSEFIANDYGYLQPIVRTSLLHSAGIAYEPDIRNMEDFALFVDCLLAGANMLLVPEPMYFYRQRAGSLTSARDLRPYEDPVRLLERLLTRFPLDLVIARALLLHLLSQKRVLLDTARFQQAVRQKRYGAALRCLRPSVIRQVFHLLKERRRRRLVNSQTPNREAYIR